jgi:DNA polymerase III epsilon subunit family exonuclease
MFTSLPEGFQRALEKLRSSGQAVPIAEVAKDLLAIKGPIATDLARRVVAAALDHPNEALPAALDARHLRPGPEASVAGLPLAAADFVVVDLETTGVSAERDAIVEIGAVRVSRLRAVDSFQTLLREPGAPPLSKAITALTGIDAALLEEAPPAPRALAAFRLWLAAAPRAPFVAHNAAFDARFTQRALDAHGLPPLRVPILCTRKLARRILPRLGRYDLDHLCAHFGIANASRHRALGDAQVTARALIELLHEALGARQLASVGDLLDLQMRAPVRRRRRARAGRGAAHAPTGDSARAPGGPGSDPRSAL